MLIDGEVAHWEAYLTLGFFFALIIMAYIADCLRRKTIQEREDAKYGHEHEKVEGRPEDQGTIVDKNLVDFYKVLLPQE